MSNWIVKAKDKGAAACNIVKSVGPFMISQSEKMSEAFARHKGRLASVEVAKELLIDEGKILNKARGELLERYAQADAVEKIRIRGDLEDICGYQQQLTYVKPSVRYLTINNSDEDYAYDLTIGEMIKNTNLLTLKVKWYNKIIGLDNLPDGLQEF